MNYYISDTHFNDINIMVYSRPQFKDINEMNELIMKNWNAKVGPDDTVFHCGDVGDYSFLNRLNGNIIVILGNHDNEEKLRKIYPNVKIYDRPVLEGWRILSHDPVSFIPKEAPYLNIHGHLHQFDYRAGTSMNWYDGNRYLNVSCEKINYTPVSDAEMLEMIGYIPM